MTARVLHGLFRSAALLSFFTGDGSTSSEDDTHSRPTFPRGLDKSLPATEPCEAAAETPQGTP